MNILFLHRSFPAQFKYITYELAKDKANNVVFITNSKDIEIEGIKKVIYELDSRVGLLSHQGNPLVKPFESAIEHGKAAAKEAQKLKDEGFVPDIIYAHSGWGVGMFMKDIFPNTPYVCYFEWFQNAQGADTGFLEEITDYQKQGIRCSNSQVLLDLQSADGGISPTNWQKSQFPKEFQQKIKVIYDGIDTEFFKPDENSKFLGFSSKDEVITYGTRGMEPYRGFPQFMQAIEKILKTRPQAQVIIAGEDRVCYRGKLEKSTFKEMMINKLDLDLNRIHFVGGLPYSEYLKMLQISSAHVYLTVPYVLSWSLMEAMSIGCPIVASNTSPVTEVIHGVGVETPTYNSNVGEMVIPPYDENGLLCDFFDINDIAEKISFALDNKDKMQQIRQNARKTILDNYSLEKCLPEHISYLKSFLK